LLLLLIHVIIAIIVHGAYLKKFSVLHNGGKGSHPLEWSGRALVGGLSGG